MLVVASSLGMAADRPMAAGGVPTSHPGVVIVDPTESQRRLVEWGISRFRDAGLDPPAFTVAFHPTLEPCFGHVGLYWGDAGRIDMCRDRLDRDTKAFLLHEMAHAWDRHRLSDDRRTAFAALRGIGEWDSRDREWGLRGPEQLAQVLTWGLMDERMLYLGIPDSGPSDLGAGYRALTGSASPFRALDDAPGELEFSPEAR